MKPHCPTVIVALDFDQPAAVRQLVTQLDPQDCCLKVGLTLFTQCGAPLVTELVRLGFRVFLDLKFHDIPQQVAGACLAAAKLGVWMINVHAAGGEQMMQAARQALTTLPTAQRPLLIAVTALTSLDASDLTAIGWHEPPSATVLRLAKLTHQAGLDGVVCSAQEALLLRKHLPKDFILVTPGIRLATDHHQDQKRVVTPKIALHNGASFLVIGRPITTAPDPSLRLQSIVSSLDQ